jgi:hypothetical protein
MRACIAVAVLAAAFVPALPAARAEWAALAAAFVLAPTDAVAADAVPTLTGTRGAGRAVVTPPLTAPWIIPPTWACAVAVAPARRPVRTTAVRMTFDMMMLLIV